MENKTILYLNSKAWYRLIKVFYLICILVALGISTTVIIENNGRRFDNKYSYISCNDGKKINLKDTSSIYLDSEYVPSYVDSEIRRLCLTNSEIGEIAKKQYSQYNDLTSEEVGKRLRDSNALFIETINVQTKNYKMNAIYKERNWFLTTCKSILTGLLILLVFEIIRRIFYYIILGKIFPKKKDNN